MRLQRFAASRQRGLEPQPLSRPHRHPINPPSKTHRALFVDEVTYLMPRRLKDKRRRGVLIINGVELAVLDIQQFAVGQQQGEGDSDVGVIANYPLSKVRGSRGPCWGLVRLRKGSSRAGAAVCDACW